ESGNPITAIAGIRAESRPDRSRGVYRPWCVRCQGSATAPRCTDGRCQERAIRHGYCLEVRPVCPKCAASGSSARRVSFAWHSLHQLDRVHRHINTDGPNGLYSLGCSCRIGTEFDLRTCDLGPCASTEAGQTTGPAEGHRRSPAGSQTPKGWLERPCYCSQTPAFQVDCSCDRDGLGFLPTSTQRTTLAFRGSSARPLNCNDIRPQSLSSLKTNARKFR